ncbi:MAG: NAD(P)/FAD-dependent oxidoreductase, partial [Gemmatimonadales bacterium]
DGHGHELPYDHLVVALGSVTNFFGIPGLREHALTMKTLGDALALRNHVIERLEEADTECAGARREELLTFTVAGGGFAGVETAAAMNDFILEALPHYPRIPRSALRVMLVEAGKHILPELGPGLGGYARRHLARRGVDIRLETRVTGVTGAGVSLSDGSLWPSQTLVWTAGATPSPLVAALPCDKERGRLVVDEYLRVPGYDNLWALGDCAAVPDAGTGLACPPTAQHALRQGRVLAANLVATLSGRPLRPFRFRTLGQLAAIGRRTGVAKVMGVMLSGFPAWWLWRTIYLSKLPRFEKKVRVALDWTLDLLFSKDLVQFLTLRSGGIGEETGPRPVPVGSAAAQREPAAAATRQVVS